MAQRKALTQTERAQIGQRHRAGVSLRGIAAELGCSWHTVRKWWRRQRLGQTTARRGRPVQGPLSTYPAELVARALELKQAHPHWGPANVKLELKRDERFATRPLPSDSRLAVLFKSRCPQAVQPHAHRPYPAPALPGVRQPHHRWQLDSQEKIPVGADQVAALLNVRDPAGALMIASQAFLTTRPKHWRKLTRREVQETLRTAFSQWGMPLEIQTDHEVLFTGAPGTDFPTSFTLWLVGLGLAHVTSRDRRPTDQAQIERNHRTLGDMSWKDQPCPSLSALQSLVDEHRARYNHELPVRAATCHRQPPLDAHPNARHSGRPFARALEWVVFDPARIDRYLAQFIWVRLVNANGQISLGGHAYAIGTAYGRQSVSVRFLPTPRRFSVALADGTFLRELPAAGLDTAELIGFLPLEEVLRLPIQIPLPLQGV